MSVSPVSNPAAASSSAGPRTGASAARGAATPTGIPAGSVPVSATSVTTGVLSSELVVSMRDFVTDGSAPFLNVAAGTRFDLAQEGANLVLTFTGVSDSKGSAAAGTLEGTHNFKVSLPVAGSVDLTTTEGANAAVTGAIAGLGATGTTPIAA